MPLRRARCARTPPCKGSALARSVPSASVAGIHQVTISNGSPSWCTSRRLHNISPSPVSPSNAATRAGAAVMPTWMRSPGSRDSSRPRASSPGRATSSPARAGRPRTKLPLPCWVSIQPSWRSTRNARTTVGRAIWNSSLSWCSLGSNDPGGYSPDSIRRRSSPTTWAYFGGVYSYGIGVPYSSYLVTQVAYCPGGRAVTPCRSVPLATIAATRERLWAGCRFDGPLGPDNLGHPGGIDGIPAPPAAHGLHQAQPAATVRVRACLDVQRRPGTGVPDEDQHQLGVRRQPQADRRERDRHQVTGCRDRVGHQLGDHQAGIVAQFGVAPFPQHLLDMNEHTGPRRAAVPGPGPFAAATGPPSGDRDGTVAPAPGNATEARAQSSAVGGQHVGD